MNKIGNVKKFIIPGFFIVCALVFLQYLFSVLYYVEPKMEYFADNTYDQTITVVAREDFAPYSYVDENGELCGFNVELMNLIANNLEMNVDFQLAPRDECMNEVKSGKVDMICNANYSPEFEDVCILSTPTERHRVVVFGLHGFESIRDLYNKKIARVIETPVKSDLHSQLGFTSIIDYETYKEAFDAIMTGEIDYIIGAYAILNYRANTMGYEDIDAVSGIINTEAFAFGFSQDNVELQEKVNEALLKIDKSGTCTQISNKWLGTHIDSTSSEDTIKNNIPQILLIYSLFLLFIIYFIVLPIYRKSQYDKATKLFDKVTTRKIIERKMATDGTLLVVDINKFKGVNDTYGHAVGDAVIKLVAESLRACTRHEDVLGRIGGDEFVVYLPTLIFEKDAYNKAIQLTKEVERRTKQNLSAVPVSISVGIAVHNKVETYGELFLKGDQALYEAKTKEGHISIYDQIDPSINCK